MADAPFYFCAACHQRFARRRESGGTIVCPAHLELYRRHAPISRRRLRAKYLEEGQLLGRLTLDSLEDTTVHHLDLIVNVFVSPEGLLVIDDAQYDNPWHIHRERSLQIAFSILRNQKIQLKGELHRPQKAVLPLSNSASAGDTTVGSSGSLARRRKPSK